MGGAKVARRKRPAAELETQVEAPPALVEEYVAVRSHKRPKEAMATATKLYTLLKLPIHIYVEDCSQLGLGPQASLRVSRGLSVWELLSFRELLNF